MPATIRAVAWDIDGTLVDSEPLHRRSLVAASGDFGLDLTGDPEDRFLGLHMSDIWDLLQPDFPAGTDGEAWRARIRQRYADRVHEVVAMPHALAVMRALTDAGVRQIAVSNSGRRIVDLNLAAIGAQAFLEGSVSFDDVTRGKPDPDPYRRGATLLGLPADAILAVEDSATGARSALAAGLRVAGLGEAGQVPGVIAIGDLSDVPGIVLG